MKYSSTRAHVYSWEGKTWRPWMKLCILLLLSEVANNVYWSWWPKLCDWIFQGNACLSIIAVTTSSSYYSGQLKRSRSCSYRAYAINSSYKRLTDYRVNQKKHAFTAGTKSLFVQPSHAILFILLFFFYLPITLNKTFCLSWNLFSWFTRKDFLPHKLYLKDGLCSLIRWCHVCEIPAGSFKNNKDLWFNFKSQEMSYCQNFDVFCWKTCIKIQLFWYTLKFKVKLKHLTEYRQLLTCSSLKPALNLPYLL